MHLNGLDAMRWLGADPRIPADDVERIVAVKLANRIVAEHERLNRG